MTLSSTMIIFAALFGLVLGSFLNVCIYRIPLKESIVFPPSNCPKCGERIRFYDNIPVLSYMILKGKCRFCKEGISIQYPIVEALSGLLSMALFLRYGLSLHYFMILLFSLSLVVISFIDIRHKIIPDIISLPGIPLGFIFSVIPGHITWYDSLLGILIGGGCLYLVAFVFERLTGKVGMGGGDIKLLAMIGGWLGFKALPFIILASSLSGTVVGTISIILSHKGLRSRIPFGPFLAFGALVYIFFGKEIVSCYIGLIR